MKKPKNENFTRNITGAATNVNASTPAFAKIDNINLPKRQSASPGGGSGLSALIGGTRCAGSTIGARARVSSADLGSNVAAAGALAPGGKFLFAGSHAGGGIDERNCTLRADSDAANSWGASNFVWHYFNGGGDPIHLSYVGLGRDLETHLQCGDKQKNLWTRFNVQEPS